MNIPQAQPIAEAIPMQMPAALQKGTENIANIVTGLKDNIATTLNEFSNQPGATPEFNYSNTIIAKIAFLILVLIVFMFLMNLGIKLIGYFTQPSDNPYLVNGMINGIDSLVIPQDPKNADSIPIQRSNNQSKGIEFTWSTWIYIDDLGNDPTKYQHIFSKGNNTFNNSNIASVNNAPGLYLGPANNNLHIIMNTVSPNDTNNVIDISNIPMRKWVHVALRLQNTIVDVYINGSVSGRLILQNVPKQNYNDVYVCQNGGFAGKLSNLRYFNYALNVFEINTVVARGPNTKMTSNTQYTKPFGSFSYLSNQWYASKL